MIVERYEKDRFNSEEQSTPIEKIGLFTDKGRELRRNTLGYVAAGDLSDRDFLNIIGQNPDLGLVEPNQNIIINNESITSRKVPMSIGSTTAFEHQDIDDISFRLIKTNEEEFTYII
jgi:hypothetical protein